jgi:maltose alpha-D-glucosyltransferase/alpha-amylase
MLFDFLTNVQVWLALAREDAEPLMQAIRTAPPLPSMAQWATFLRNHDELDLSRLSKEQQADVFRAFAPRPDMRIFDRGIRRRLAPMLRGDRRRIELAYALQFALPGTPVIRYGEEIGMGEDLALRGRDAMRTPMQWDTTPGAGFTTAPADRQVRPVVTRGTFRNRVVSVEAQQRDATSLLRWFSDLVATRRECPEIGVGTCSLVDVALPRHVLAHRFDAPEGSMLLLHNLADRPATVDVGRMDGVDGGPREVFSDAAYEPPDARLTGLTLSGYGYRWIRLRRSRRA